MKSLHPDLSAVSSASAAEQMRQCGYLEVPINGKNLCFHKNRALSQFSQLIADPERDKFIYRGTDEDYDIGFYDRNGEAKETLTPQEQAEHRNQYDRKEYFHADADTYQLLKRQGAPVERYPGLFQACRQFNIQASSIAKVLAQTLDHGSDGAYPGSFRQKIEDPRSRVVTRIMRYKPQEEGVFIAALHRDKAAVTVHWFSTHAGLVFYDAQAQPVVLQDTDPNTALVFLGRKAWAAMRGTYGKGSVHGAHNAVALQGREHRFVIVTFVHCFLDDDDKAWASAHEGDIKIRDAEFPSLN